MIREVAGDILLSKAQLIAHGVAAGDHFDTGLALSLRERWPAMVKDFRHYCHTKHPKPGTLWVWSGADATRIACLITQEEAPAKHLHPGPARVEYVEHAVHALRDLVEAEGIKSLALPKLSTGVGGLSWDVVLPILQKHLGKLDIPVWVYSTYKQSVAASELAAV